MTLTILGLAIPTLVSLIGVIGGERRRPIKTALLLLAVSGFALGVYSSQKTEAEKQKAQVQEDQTRRRLEDANQQLADLRTAMTLVKSSVGDLTTLNEISGPTKYYVRIATAGSANDLTPYLERLRRNFPGLNTTHMACVREPTKDISSYSLVFGQNLDLAAAEVYQRLAMSHHLTPETKTGQPQVAAIRPEDGTQCQKP